MSKRGFTHQKKLAVLSVIEANRSILFGNFKNTNSKEKQSAWEAILEKAKALELASADRTWTYARDQLFGLWKSRTIAKKDNAKKTGSGGGKDKKLDEVDLAILKIIDGDSAVVNGLEMPESDVTNNIENSEIILALDSENVDFINTLEQCPGEEVSTIALSSSSTKVSSVKKRKRENLPSEGNLSASLAKARKYVGNSSMYQLKEELIRVEIYHRRLQALKLERELEIPLSEYTKPLFNN